jgi:signal transduction histidine kinase
VRVRGDLVGIVREQRQTVYQCRESGVVFDAILPHPAPELPIGAHLSLTGICSLETAHPLGVSYQNRFRLALRSSADLVVLRAPYWWTSERIWWGLAGMAGVGAGVFGWAFMLHRQVAAQTAVIRGQLERETIHEERQRIAREWHDTMEQQLMGVDLLLDDSSAQFSRGHLPAGGESFQLARRMLGHCREESRASIQGLRSLTLERHGLTGAFQELLPPLAEAAGAHFSLQVTGDPCPIGSREEHHLLRIAQEAVANATHHAHAQSIEVRLDYGTAVIQMEIRDDGRGFDPEAAFAKAREGHFGLQGIAERAEKIRASHTIESAPGKGTRIVIKLAKTAVTRDNRAPSLYP